MYWRRSLSGHRGGAHLLRKDIWKPFPRLDATVVEPGDVTARMALPWHTDFLECGQDWWPVARPNQVKPKLNSGTYKDWIGQIWVWRTDEYGRQVLNMPESRKQMVAKWDTLGFVIPQGEEFLEVEAEDVPYVFVVSPEVDFAAVPEGETETHAVSLEAVTGTMPVTLRADPPTGPFSLISQDEIKLQRTPGRGRWRFWSNTTVGQQQKKESSRFADRQRGNGLSGFESGLALMSDWDVVVVGAGPGGCACALSLLRGGFRVLLLDAGRVRPRLGESLPPRSIRRLRDLGFGEFVDSAHHPSMGIESTWDGHEGEHNFLFSPYGYGAHLDTRKFCAAMLEAIQANNGVVKRSSTVKDLRGPPWTVEFTNDSGSAAANTTWVVDATGRLGLTYRRLERGQRRLDNLVACVRVTTRRDRRQVTSVESAPSGWWFSAPVSKDLMIAGLPPTPTSAPVHRNSFGSMLSSPLRKYPHALLRPNPM